ncbi:MAG: DUF4129 domain-containing protein [Spirulinaceae cyanobacterium]
MSIEGSFDKNSLGWQLGILRQRLGEWLELNFSPRLPNFSLPSGSVSPLVLGFIEFVLWLLLALAIAWTIWQLWLLLNPYFQDFGKQRNKKTQKGQKEALDISVSAWLARAQKMQQQGNYKEACFCLYQAMLKRLDEKEIISQELSRTDGEYRQLVRNTSQPEPYNTLLNSHEELCFSQAEASQEIFAECKEAYGQIGNK